MDRYSAGNDELKSNLASLLWRLGWPSEDAAMLLLRDIKTPHESLRINVQYALGTLSSNPVVIQSLLDNMRNDENPLLRDKAACALANDQVYLTMRQTYPLLRGLVDGLSDSNAQVRKISIKALKIHTGQTMGFVANADPQARNEAIYRWQAWLDDYQRAL
jgi:HEAT repeat protein